MKNFNTNTENSPEWLTPPRIVEALGPFDLDPCACVDRPWDTAKIHYTKNENGFDKPWEGRVWLNPPYGNETFKWIKRLADHGNGIALIFARTETKGFFDQVWDRADAIFFFKGRLKFYRPNGIQGGSANAPSCLIIYGRDNVLTVNKALKSKLIDGVLVTSWVRQFRG